YVYLDKKRFIPEDRGRVVTAFLENFFSRYVEYDFTAQLENRLDDITAGSEPWKKVLTDFWKHFNQTVQEVSPRRTSEVLEKIDASMEQHLFPTPESRICPECKEGTLSLKVGRFGAFIGCSRYPNCKYTHPFTKETENNQTDNKEEDSISLGTDGANHNIILKKGPYGWYVQLGDGKESKRISLPKTYSPHEVTLEQALGLLSLPKILGNDSQTNEPIEVSIGRFGPYVKKGNTFQSLASSDDVLTIDLARAVALLQNGKTKSESSLIGSLEDEKIFYTKGRYGPYLKWGKKNIALPKKWKSTQLQPSLEEAIQIIKNPEKK
ncbi:MAG: DNA topoisomerase I, partial [Clostridia bacterium]|nr:DNA topoisomerase I [Clostridia bacterium]